MVRLGGSLDPTRTKYGENIMAQNASATIICHPAVSYCNMAAVIVVDINGVLGEVTKRRASTDRDCIFLPSGQRFYLNTAAESFLKSLCSRGFPLVLWTSRLRKNARPIENLPPIKNIPFIAMLHGEDCAHANGNGYHPIKRVSYLRERLPPHLKESEIVLIDDSPKYIETDPKSRIVCCETYRAEEDNYWNLQDILESHI